MIKNKYIAILLILFFFLCTASSVQIHPPWGEDGNNLYIQAFGKDRYLIVKTRTSAAINAAIDSLGANGGEIYLPEGTYAITTEVTLDNSNITITGCGNGTILQLGADVSLIRAPDDVDNIILRNFVVDGAGTATSANNALIDIEGTENTVIDHIHFKNFEEWALYIKTDNADDDFSIVSNCIFEDSFDNTSVAIYADSGLILEGCIHIEKCEFIDCDVGIHGNNPILIIDSCKFEDCLDSAITTTNGRSTQSIVSNCEFIGNVDYALYLINTHYWIVNSNTFKDCDDFSICLDAGYGHIVCNNYLITPNDKTQQILLTNNCHSCIISNNRFELQANDSDYHIYLDSVNTDVSIYGNYFSTFVDTSSIYLTSSATDAVIYGNKNTTITCGAGTCTFGDFDGYVYGRTLGSVSSIKTADYTVTTLDFGKTLVMNSASDYTFTLPSVGATEDGATVYFEKTSTGKLTIDAADTDYVHTSGAGDGIFNAAGQSYATIALEYRHTDTRWYIKNGQGAWVPYD